MDLLPPEIRTILPPLDSNESIGGQAIIHLKLFTPDSDWTWYATCGQQEGDDFLFFGLVDGFEKELGYLSLSELQSARGPLGLAIERDLYWKPKPLCEIAPELFHEAKQPEEDSHGRP